MSPKTAQSIQSDYDDDYQEMMAVDVNEAIVDYVGFPTSSETQRDVIIIHANLKRYQSFKSIQRNCRKK